MFRILCAICVCLPLLAGCSSGTAPEKIDDAKGKSVSTDSKVKENLAKLDPEDRRLAEEQRLCAVSDAPLGSMGVPVKVTFADGSAFLCCKACEKAARKNEATTLRKVAELKKK